MRSQEKRCATAVWLWSETAEDLDAGCLLHPDVHGLSCLMSERSWLANAPWKPRNGALVPAAVWSSPYKSCRSWLAPRRGGEEVASLWPIEPLPRSHCRRSVLADCMLQKRGRLNWATTHPTTATGLCI